MPSIFKRIFLLSLVVVILSSFSGCLLLTFASLGTNEADDITPSDITDFDSSSDDESNGTLDDNDNNSTSTDASSFQTNWTMFDSIGVDSSEAKEIFTKLGLEQLSDLEPIGTSTINYQLIPYGREETPINIIVENGVITQVTIRNLCVSDKDRKSFFEDNKLPTTWYYSDEADYFFEGDTTLGFQMYDTVMFDNPYHIGVIWETRTFYYFE